MKPDPKAAYSARQKRKAAHIEHSYEARGVPPEEAQARAWATVNKQSGGGDASGSGRHTSAAHKAHARQDSAERAARSRQAGQHLSDCSKTELLEMARERQLPGRSSMRKAQLLAALKRLEGQPHG